jgi:hypothetical protein
MGIREKLKLVPEKVLDMQYRACRRVQTCVIHVFTHCMSDGLGGRLILGVVLGTVMAGRYHLPQLNAYIDQILFQVDQRVNIASIPDANTVYYTH